MYAVGYVADGYLSLGPPREQILENPATHFAMDAAHAIHRCAPPDRQVSHIERFIVVFWILPAESQEILERNSKVLFGIVFQVPFHQRRWEPVKPGVDRSMRGEHVPRSGGDEGSDEVGGIVFHEA